MVHGYEMFFNDYCDLCNQKHALEEHGSPKASTGYIVPCCNFDLHLVFGNCQLLSE
jgi:hypothetical protein